MNNRRYRYILWFFFKLIMSFIWWDIVLPRIGLRKLSHQTRPKRLQHAAHLFRLEAVRLGGVMIKVGQFLSSRLDMLPSEITDELSGLQDEVLPDKFEDIRQVIEAEFSMPLAEKFLDIKKDSVASASIGQVYEAHILPEIINPDEGEPQPVSVVVKVQRPHIGEIVKIDLAALGVVCGWIYRYPPIRKRANVPALMEEFSQSLLEEIDYIHEGKNAERFAANFKDQADICVPKVYWQYTTEHVLTLEDVRSIKINDYEAIDAAGLDRAEIPERLVNTYLKQIFEDHFFHADPHPGNLFILPTDGVGVSGKRSWKLVFVDFGMTGILPENLQTGLKEMLISVGTKDAPRVVKAFQTLGVLIPGANIRLLEKATSRMFEAFWGKSTTEMMQMDEEEAQRFVTEFRELMYEMPFQVPENMILLGRCLGILSGICTGLNPEFNFWTSMAPYAQKLVQGENQSTFQTILKELVTDLQILVSLPKKTEAFLNQVEQGTLEAHDPALLYRIDRLERNQSQMIKAIFFAAFLMSGVQAYLADRWVLAGILGFADLVTLLLLLFTRRRNFAP